MNWKIWLHKMIAMRKCGECLPLLRVFFCILFSLRGRANEHHLQTIWFGRLVCLHFKCFEFRPIPSHICLSFYSTENVPEMSLNGLWMSHCFLLFSQWDRDITSMYGVILWANRRLQNWDLQIWNQNRQSNQSVAESIDRFNYLDWDK